jgi:hypothetical protein
MFGESQFYTPYEQDVPYGQVHNMQEPMPQQEPYGMGNNMPQPMGFMPSNQQGYPSLGTSFSNNSMNQNYAKGGRVSNRGFKESMQRVSGLGQGGDTVLAHISPEEAQELAYKYGADINPLTGLPQFNWFDRLSDRINDFIDRNGEGIASNLGRTLAVGAGTMLGGPLGGILGGSLFGAGFEGNRERPNYGRGALMGGLHGLVQGVGAPMIGNALGVNPSGMAGQLFGMGAPKFGTLGAGLGTKAASMLGGAASGAKSLGGGLLSNLVGGESAGAGGGLLGGGLLSNALLGTALLGTLGGKKVTPKEPSMQDVINAGPRWSPEQQARNVRPTDRALVHFDPNNFRPGFEPERLYFSDVNPPAQYYAHGGHVFSGNEGGQADNIKTTLPAGDYIVDASSTSDLGDGNSEAGSLKIIHGLNALTKGRRYKSGGSPRGSVPAFVSAGETRIDRDLVTALGKGNNKKGAKLLDGLVKNVRKHKRSNPNGLPPKAKSLKSYLNMRSK